MENKIDKIVEQHRDADIDALCDEKITDADYPEPEPRPRINPVIEFAVMLHDAMNYHMPKTVISFGHSMTTGKPYVHVDKAYFMENLAKSWNVTSKDCVKYGFVEYKIDFDLCDVFCIEQATFERVTK